MKNWYFDFNKVPKGQKQNESNITQSESTITESEIKRSRTKKIEVDKQNKTKSELSFLKNKRISTNEIETSLTKNTDSLNFLLINTSKFNESWNNIKLVSLYIKIN
jgi:hypothetical protein